jgi:hypothetical protein
MATRTKKSAAVTSVATMKEIDQVSELLGKLVLQGKFAHMKTHVQAIMGGLLLPSLVDLGQLDAKEPEVADLLKSYSKPEVKKMLNPEPVKVTEVVHERPVFRRLKTGVNKEKRIVRALDTAGRDILIRWWNVNQRLIPKDDPVCATLTAQVNALNSNEEPLSSMQIAGYFSHLCRTGLCLAEERDARLRSSMKRGAHTIMPEFSKELLEAIKENWEMERANEAARVTDHAKLANNREKGITTPVIAKF